MSSYKVIIHIFLVILKTNSQLSMFLRYLIIILLLLKLMEELLTLAYGIQLDNRILDQLRDPIIEALLEHS